MEMSTTGLLKNTLKKLISLWGELDARFAIREVLVVLLDENVNELLLNKRSVIERIFVRQSCIISEA